MGSIIPFDSYHAAEKPVTTDAGDTGRQVVNSQDPGVRFWKHPCRGGLVSMIVGFVCPYCGKDADGNYHKLEPDA